MAKPNVYGRVERITDKIISSLKDLFLRPSLIKHLWNYALITYNNFIIGMYVYMYSDWIAFSI